METARNDFIGYEFNRRMGLFFFFFVFFKTAYRNDIASNNAARKSLYDKSGRVIGFDPTSL